jgi:hypothetical protein
MRYAFPPYGSCRCKETLCLSTTLKLPQSSGFMHVWQNEVERLAVISLQKQPGGGQALNLSRGVCPFRKTGELQPSTPPPRILADRK